MPDQLPLGGYSALDPSLLEGPPLYDPQAFFRLEPGQHSWFATGRGALRLALGTMDFVGRYLLLPDFLCGKVLLDLAQDLDLPWHLYPVKEDLSVDWNVVQGLADSSAAVLVINYFGVVDQSSELARFKKTRPEITTILDCALDPFYITRTAGRELVADIVVASFRKAFPLPDTAVLCAKKNLPKTKSTNLGPDPSVEPWLAGALLKHSFIAAGGPVKETLFVEAHERAKALISSQPHPASAAGFAILERLDLPKVMTQRQANYTALAEALPMDLCRPLVSNPTQGAVPTHLPVLVSEGRRDALKSYLSERSIFCPVHWPRDSRLKQIGLASQTLYQNILSLIVDQSLGQTEIGRISEELAAFQKEAK